MDIDYSDYFATLKKFTTLAAIVKTYSQFLLKHNDRYLNPTLSILRIANSCLFSKFESLCSELLLIPTDDTIWIQEKDNVNEAIFRILDFSQYILRNVKLYYDDADKALRD